PRRGGGPPPPAAGGAPGAAGGSPPRPPTPGAAPHPPTGPPRRVGGGSRGAPGKFPARRWRFNARRRSRVGGAVPSAPFSEIAAMGPVSLSPERHFSVAPSSSTRLELSHLSKHHRIVFWGTRALAARWRGKPGGVPEGRRSPIQLDDLVPVILDRLPIILAEVRELLAEQQPDYAGFLTEDFAEVLVAAEGFIARLVRLAERDPSAITPQLASGVEQAIFEEIGRLHYEKRQDVTHLLAAYRTGA